MAVANCHSNEEIKLRSKEQSEEYDENPWIVFGLDLNWEATEPILGFKLIYHSHSAYFRIFVALNDYITEEYGPETNTHALHYSWVTHG